MSFDWENEIKTRRFAVHTLLCVVVALSVLPLSAQNIPGVVEGDRVRIDLSTGRYAAVSGIFQEARQDTLFISSADASRVFKVPRTQIREFSVYRGKRRNLMRGLGMGAVIGAASGAVAGLAFREIYFLDSWADVSTMEAAAYGGAYGAAYGGMIGLALSLLIKRDRWEKVLVTEIKPVVHLLYEGQVGFGFSIRKGKSKDWGH